MPNKNYLTYESNESCIKFLKLKIKTGLILLKKSTSPTIDDTLRHLAFDNAAQAHFISIINSGKIIIANWAACKLLGYSKKELLTKSQAIIVDVSERRFKKMLKQRTAEGNQIGGIRFLKNGQLDSL